MTTANDTRRILIGVSGGIAAYKACDVVSALRKEGRRVSVIMTHNATRIVTPLTLETLSHERVVTDLFTDAEQHLPDHIDMKHAAAVLAIVPATANLLAKAAAGIADDALSTTLITVTCPILFCPAMNTAMWNHPTVARNIQTLQAFGHQFLMPVAGELACGDVGDGKLAPVEEILAAIRRLADGQLAQSVRKSVKGKPS